MVKEKETIITIDWRKARFVILGIIIAAVILFFSYKYAIKV
jgi:hypothetical protein